MKLIHRPINDKKCLIQVWEYADFYSTPIYSMSIEYMHWFQQTVFASTLVHDVDAQFLHLILPEGITAEELNEVLAIYRESKHSVLLCTVGYINKRAVEDIEGYWAERKALVEMVKSAGFLDVTPIHHTMAQEGYIWLLFENTAAEELLQLDTLRDVVASHERVMQYDLSIPTDLAEYVKNKTEEKQ